MARWYGENAEMGSHREPGIGTPMSDITFLVCEESWNEKSWSTQDLEEMIASADIHPESKGWMRKELKNRC